MNKVNDAIHGKLKILDCLLGGTADSRRFKGDFIKMAIQKNKELSFRDIADIESKLRVTNSQLSFNPRGNEGLNTLNDIKYSFRGMN